ncbi:mucin-5AC-like [Haliotis rufescens]|uniref:mucin-5AC-like n=1 Tax=Haliotis rufescens TaxID=6454 RepID=UPI00201F024B|nr:mucin-5AC-like [Haliotis rufescens]
MYFFIIGVAVSMLDYPVSGQNASCNSQNCIVNIATSNFTSGDNKSYTISGQSAWVTDGLTSGPCASVSSLYPAWKAEFGQNRTVSRIKIFLEGQQGDIHVFVGNRVCHTPASNYTWMPEYTLVCQVPVTGDYLLMYRAPTGGMLNLTLCEVEIYATPSPATTTHGPSSTTISSTPAIASSTGESARDAIATPTITLDTASTTISSTPSTVSPAYESTSDAIPTPTTTLDTATTYTHLEAGTPAMSPYENSQTEATKSLYFTPSSELYQSYPSHVVAPSPTVSPDTASIPTSAMSSSPTNRQNSFTWPGYSLSSSQGSSSMSRSTTVTINSNPTDSQSPTASLTSLMSDAIEPTTLHLSSPNLSATTTHSSLNVQPFRSTPTLAVLTTTAVISNSATLSNHDITLATNEASTPYTTFQNVSIHPSTDVLTTTVSMSPTSATTTTANSASETNIPATSTGSVTPTPVTSKTTLTTILTSNGGTPTTTSTKPATDGTTPNVGQVSGTSAPKAANMNIVVIVATVGGCVVLLYIAGMTVLVLRQNRKDVYRPGQAE